MTKIMMSVPVAVEIVDKKKKKEVLKVEVRTLTKEERKERSSLEEKYRDLSTALNKKSSKIESIAKKREYSEKLEKYDDALSYQEKMDILMEEIEDITKEVLELGGDDFFEKIAQENFELLISGEGKERLAEIAEIKGYTMVNNLLYKARDEVEGKQRNV